MKHAANTAGGWGAPATIMIYALLALLIYAQWAPSAGVEPAWQAAELPGELLPNLPGASEIPTTPPGVSGAWATTPITYSFVNCPSTLGCTEAQHSIRAAFAEWQRNCGIEFRETVIDGRIAVGWASDSFLPQSPFDGQGGIAAYATALKPGKTSHILFDDQEQWVSGQPAKADQAPLKAVALHEIGHTLGLGHSASADTVMWPVINGYTALQPSDIQTCQAAFGQPAIRSLASVVMIWQP